MKNLQIKNPNDISVDRVGKNMKDLWQGYLFIWSPQIVRVQIN